MRTATELQAEAAELRQHPLNAMSFHGVTARATNRWALPKPTGDFSTDYSAGSRLAAELIDATQAAERLGKINNTGILILLVVQRMADHSMRMGFLDVLAEALCASLSGGELLRAQKVKWSLSFANRTDVFRMH